MNEVFDAYAAYYDLLYRDKNYTGEATYVNDLIRARSPAAKDILELGCGTGIHACELARRNYSVIGVDRSKLMVQLANQRSMRMNLGGQAVFDQGDLRTFRADRSFDVVLALFHVMSYQTSNEDLAAAMTTAAASLRPGGLFIFDCWYGPGVLTDPPVTRVRRMDGSGFTVTRIAEPRHYPNHNRVDVHYEIIVEHATRIERINETHSMRYLFAPEVAALLKNANLKFQTMETWMSGAEPSLQTWNVCFIATR
jgi:SAM-dependent methyltransferase